jgi:hypothetical protein
MKPNGDDSASGGNKVPTSRLLDADSVSRLREFFELLDKWSEDLAEQKNVDSAAIEVAGQDVPDSVNADTDVDEVTASTRLSTDMEHEPGDTEPPA